MGIPENCEQLKPEDNWGQGQEAWLQLWEGTGMKPGATCRQGGLTAINPAQDTELVQSQDQGESIILKDLYS